MLGKNCQDKSHHSSVPFAKILYFNATLCTATITIIINFDVGKAQIAEFHSLSDFVSFYPNIPFLSQDPIQVAMLSLTIVCLWFSLFYSNCSDFVLSSFKKNERFSHVSYKPCYLHILYLGIVSMTITSTIFINLHLFYGHVEIITELTSSFVIDT